MGDPQASRLPLRRARGDRRARNFLRRRTLGDPQRDFSAFDADICANAGRLPNAPADFLHSGVE